MGLSWRSDGVAFAVLVLGSATIGGLLGPALVDDAFIYLRIARQLATGNGWSFNTGATVSAATGPLYVLFLACLCRALGAGARVLVIAYGLGLVACASGSYLLWRAQGVAKAFVAGAVAAGCGSALTSAGLETSWFLAGLVWVSYFFAKRGDSWLVGSLTGLVTLLRPDGVVLAAVLTLFHLMRARRPPARVLAAMSLTVAPWLAFSWLQFGALLPNCMRVKAQQSMLAIWALQPPFAFGFLAQLAHPYWTLPLATLGAWSLRASARRASALLPPITFGAAELAAYSAMRAPAGYLWYLAPENLALDYLALLGVWALLDHARTRYAARTPRTKCERALASLATHRLSSLLCGALLPALVASVPARLPARYRLAEQYRALGEWIQAHRPPGEVIAATEIGYLGFFSGHPIRDVHGLLHPDALHDIRQGHAAWWLREPLPELVVVHGPAWDWEPLHADFPSAARALFEDCYVAVHREDGPDGLSGTVSVYELTRGARFSPRAATRVCNTRRI